MSNLLRPPHWFVGQIPYNANNVIHANSLPKKYNPGCPRPLIRTVELLERPRQIGGGDPVVIEEPQDLGRIEGVQSGRRQLPPLGWPGAADDGLLEPSGRIVVQDAADLLARYFERMDGVAGDVAQRPRPQHQRLAADLDGISPSMTQNISSA